MNTPLLNIFSFPNSYQEADAQSRPLKMRLFYEGELGCLRFETETASLTIEGISFVPQVSDELIGYSFITRADDSTTFYQDIFCNGALVPRWTILYNKMIDSFSLKIYAVSYRLIHDPARSEEPVFEWRGKVCDYMMALKDFMMEWPYAHTDKMSFV